MILNPDFKEFVKLLEEHEVKYLTVGGYALAYHGYPRFTQDIDFWIWTDEENAQKIVRVLEDFGFKSLGIAQKEFTNQDNIIQLGYPPNRIDLITSIDGVEFEKAYQKRDVFREEGFSIYFIGIDELILNKRTSGRLQDLADLEILEKIKARKGSE